MVQKALIRIDLNQFKMHINVPERLNVSLHFASPSRKFYLSLIALVVREMKRQERITSIPLNQHHDLLALLNETVGGGAGSSNIEQLLPRIYRKWKNALPDLEHGPLFKVLGRSKEYEDAVGKTYAFSEDEKDLWANLFEYKGSQEHVRLRFSVDKLGAVLDDVAIVYGEDPNLPDSDAWEKFVENLRLETGKKKRSIDAQSAGKDRIRIPARFVRTMLSPRQWVALGLLVGLIVFVSLLLSRHQAFQKHSQEIEASFTEGSKLPLPEKPSIAVLPFANLSGDPQQEYLCDGITEQIITAISRMPKIFVIARNSTFTYKGKPVMVQQVGEELGVKYVLEGSVQRSGDRVRITAQLVEAATGGHVWSGRYDRTVSDIFALQDDITLQVIQSLGLKLTEGEQVFMLGVGTQNLEAYLKVLESLWLFRKWTPEGLVLCRKKAKEAIALDPAYAMAWAMVVWSLMLEVHLGYSESSQEALAEAERATEKVMNLDLNGNIAYYLSSYVYLFRRQYDKALEAIKKAEALNPNGADVTAFHGLLLYHSGRPQDAIGKFEKAIRLNPMPEAWYWHNLGICYRIIEDYNKAITAYKKAITINPDHFSAWTGITAAYMLSGQEAKAGTAAKEVLRIQPEFSLEQYRKSLLHKDQADIRRFIGALRKAGLR
jgi:TolB-like protein/Flp pilus assembly protein TadD